jgi:glycosyltransferase involved in cell wall biosynthesis
MGAYAAWHHGSLNTPARVDPGRTVLVSDFEPTAELLARLFGAPPHVVVLPEKPYLPMPGVICRRFRMATNPLVWDSAVDDAIRGGADTVAFLLPPHEVRGQTLLRLRGLGVRRVLITDGVRLRSHNPRLLALRRGMATIIGRTIRALGGRDPDAQNESQCRAILAQAPPRLLAIPWHPLRVAHFVASLNSGGAERQACHAVILQQRDGLDVRLLTRRAVVDDDGHYRLLLRPSAVPVRRIGASWHPGFPESWRRRGLSPEPLRLLPPELRCMVADLMGELLTDPVDVLHCYVDDCNVAGLIAAALAGTPAVVLSFRNGNPTNFPGLYRPWIRPWYRAALGRPGLVLSANSAAGARDYERWLSISAGSVAVVRNAFEAAPAPPRDAALRWRRENGLDRDKPVVAGVFRLEAEKRPLYFLECIERLSRLVPGLRVVMAGVGTMEPAVRAAIDRCRLTGVVRVLGQRCDVPTILAASDVLLLTSDWEGTPNVLLEAQHYGCVPVATDAGGSVEALAHGRTGLLVGRDDVAAAVAAVAGLLADPVRRLRMATAGPAFVAERFSPRTLLESNRRLYRTALDNAVAEPTSSCLSNLTTRSARACEVRLG